MLHLVLLGDELLKRSLFFRCELRGSVVLVEAALGGQLLFLVDQRLGGHS